MADITISSSIIVTEATGWGAVFTRDTGLFLRHAWLERDIISRACKDKKIGKREYSPNPCTAEAIGKWSLMSDLEGRDD